MMVKGIGAILIFVSCSFFGFAIAAAHRKEVHFFRKFILALDLMECELQYQLTPLPELCRRAGKRSSSAVGWVLDALSKSLEQQTAPDVDQCMANILSDTDKLSRRQKRLFRNLGSSLGHYDLVGQVKGLQNVRSECMRELNLLEQNQSERLKSYQTLGICAGAALVIVLF